MGNKEIVDISTFILSKSIATVKELEGKSPEWQNGFHAGCRFSAEIAEEYRRRQDERLQVLRKN